MTTFIDRLAACRTRENCSEAAALREAMLELRKRIPSPARWASFAVFGAQC